MPTSDPDFIFVAGDATRTPVNFLNFAPGTKLVVHTRGVDYPYVKANLPVRIVWLASDPNKTPIDPATISSLPPDTALVVSVNGVLNTTQAGSVFIPPIPTLATVTMLVRERASDSLSSNKPSNPTSF